MEPSLFSLWFAPAFLSFATVLLAYFGSRKHCSSSFSAVLGILFGSCFWMLFLGRFSHPAVLLLFWTCLGSLALVRFWSAERRLEIPSALLLGVVMGTGFYTYHSWAPVALVAGLAVLYKAYRSRAGLVPFAVFAFTSSLCSVPLVLEAAEKGFGDYIGMQFAPSQVGPAGLLLAPFHHARSILWGSESFYYTTEWGGFFHPFWASLLFIGWAGLFRPSTRVFGIFATLALATLSLPGVLSTVVNPMHVVQCLPLLLLFIAAGFHFLLEAFPAKARKPTALLFLATAVAVDLFHLLGPFQTRWQWSDPRSLQNKTPEYAEAYRILRDRADSAGPGHIFTHFQPDWTDRSLDLATYPFQARTGSSFLGPAGPPWIAFICNVNYLPFLQERFPNGHWTPLSRSKGPRGGLLLGILDLTEIGEPGLERWRKADQALARAVSALMRRPENGSYEEVRRALFEAYPLLRGDPFLESCFWEQVYTSYNSDRAYGNRLVRENFQGSLQALQFALSRGHPAAHLYNELGCLRVIQGRHELARDAFRSALRSPYNDTPAGENLRSLESRAPTNVPRKGNSGEDGIPNGSAP